MEEDYAAYESEEESGGSIEGEDAFGSGPNEDVATEVGVEGGKENACEGEEEDAIDAEEENASVGEDEDTTDGEEENAYVGGAENAFVEMKKMNQRVYM